MPCSGMAAFHQKATTSSWVTTSTVPRHSRDHPMTFFTPCVTKCGTKCVTKMANTLFGAWNTRWKAKPGDNHPPVRLQGLKRAPMCAHSSKI